MSAVPYMLMGKGVGSSSEEETVIVAYAGHPVNLHHFYFGSVAESGLRHSPAKGLTHCVVRGFESLRFRQYTMMSFIDSGSVVWGQMPQA